MCNIDIYIYVTRVSRLPKLECHVSAQTLARITAAYEMRLCTASLLTRCRDGGMERGREGEREEQDAMFRLSGTTTPASTGPLRQDESGVKN